MKLKKSSFLLLMILFVLLASCASPPDVPVCVEIHPAKGWCTFTISNKSFYVDDVNKFEDKTWWEMRPTNVQVPYQSWEKIKTFIIKNCKKSKKCKNEITTWDRSLTQIEEKLNEKVSY